MIIRLIDFLKMNRITVLMTSLIDGGKALETSQVNISSLVDMWLMLDNLLQNGVRTRTLSVVKARGMGNSNQTHEVLISKKGIEIKHAARSGKYS
jgi:circadian clock protein KaiC